MRRPLIIGIVVIAIALIASGVGYTLGRNSVPAASPSPSASATASNTPSPSPSGPAACANANLKLSFGIPQGAAGTNYQTLVFTNTGATCTIYGFPGISLVDASGKQLGSPAARSDSVPAKAVVLANGATAHSVIGFPNAGNFDAGVCSATSTSLKIFPPNATASQLLPLAENACPGMSVQAVQSGSGS